MHTPRAPNQLSNSEAQLILLLQWVHPFLDFQWELEEFYLQMLLFLFLALLTRSKLFYSSFLFCFFFFILQ